MFWSEKASKRLKRAMQPVPHILSKTAIAMKWGTFVMYPALTCFGTLNGVQISFLGQGWQSVQMQSCRREYVPYNLDFFERSGNCNVGPASTETEMITLWTTFCLIRRNTTDIESTSMTFIKLCHLRPKVQYIVFHIEYERVKLVLFWSFLRLWSSTVKRCAKLPARK